MTTTTQGQIQIAESIDYHANGKGEVEHDHSVEEFYDKTEELHCEGDTLGNTTRDAAADTPNMIAEDEDLYESSSSNVDDNVTSRGVSSASAGEINDIDLYGNLLNGAV